MPQSYLTIQRRRTKYAGANNGKQARRLKEERRVLVLGDGSGTGCGGEGNRSGLPVGDVGDWIGLSRPAVIPALGDENTNASNKDGRCRQKPDLSCPTLGNHFSELHGPKNAQVRKTTRRALARNFLARLLNLYIPIPFKRN
jgi:hypothetical protein